MKIMYRIFEIKNSYPHTLFHGVEGRRELIKNRWYMAKEKMVSDGSNGTSYLSGFHCLPTVEECRECLKIFTSERELGIYSIIARGLRKKEHSPRNVWLAKSMFIIRETGEEGGGEG